MLPTAAQPTSLLDGLLTRDPRVQYPTVLPLGVLTEPDPAGSLLSEQRTVLAMPELARGLIEGITAPRRVLQGEVDPMTGAMLTAGAAPVGGLLARAPAGAVGMNVFHGTPHKFAPEPGFPQGRPRLDKMGTGEGAQAYGPGFYSAEAPGTARTYADQIASDRRREMGEADSAHVFAAKDFFRHGEDAEAGLRVAYPDISDKELRAALMEASGNAPRPQTYKLDIPDADAAKLLDYDAPISQQPQVVQDAIDRLGFMPDNPEEMAGGDVWYRMRQQLGEDEAAAAMRGAGVPGLRYKDAMSRGTDSASGTRNFVVWDQDVLDRTQILQRNDETFFSNAKPAAAAGGLLNQAARDGVSVEASRRGNILEIGKIEVAEGKRGQGLADQRLQQLIDEADEQGLTLALTPSDAFGASKSRLERWYKRHGFVRNTGRNKNFGTREAYIREPILSANPAPAAIPGLLMGNPAMTQQQMQSLLADPYGA